MSTKLEKIDAKIAEAEQALADLQPVADLSNSSEVAQKRAGLKEELAILGEAREAEQARLDAERQKEEAAARAKALKGVADRLADMEARDAALVKQAREGLATVVEALGKRGELFTQAGAGLHDPEVAPHLTRGDRGRVVEQLKPPQFTEQRLAATWAELAADWPAVQHVLPGSPRVGGARPSLAPVGTSASQAVRELADSEPEAEPEPPAMPEPEPVKPAGLHQSVDPRPESRPEPIAERASAPRHLSINPR